MSDENSNRPNDPTQAELLEAIRTLAGRMERMERALVDLQPRPTGERSPSGPTGGGTFAPAMDSAERTTGPSVGPQSEPETTAPAGFVDPSRLAAETDRKDRRTAGGPSLGAANAPAAAAGKGGPKLFRSSRGQDRTGLSAQPAAAPEEETDSVPPSLAGGEKRHSRIGRRFSDRADERDPRGIDPALSPQRRQPRRRRRGAGLVFVGVLGLAIFGGLAGYVWLENFRDRQRAAQVEREFGALLEQEADETLPAEGQSPIPRDEDDDLIVTPQDPADAATDPETEADTADGEPAAVAPPQTDDGSTEAAPTETAQAESPAAADAVPAPDAPQTDAPGLSEAAPTPPRQDGPPIETAPLSDVQAVELDRDLAPLPENASDELRDLAESAIDGDPDSQHDLGNLYASGGEVEQDFERAAFWYQRASANGIVNATYNLGVLTTRGLGVPTDPDRAFTLFRQAAEAGHPDAQFALGIAFLSGNGTDPNPQSAVRWLQAASASGNPRGAFALGQLYERGIDGAPDLAAAAGWYRVAAEAGDSQAQDALDRLTAAEAAVPAAGNAVPVPAETPTPTSTAGNAGTADDADLNRDGVRELQTRLNALGFDAGPEDGLMGPTTAGAIRAFQQSRGLPVTGDATQSVLSALRQEG